MSEQQEVKALAQVTSELRDEPMPLVDWDEMEARLLARVAEERGLRRRRVAPWVLGLTGLAAAAAVVLFVGRQGAEESVVPPESKPIVPTAVSAVPGGSLALGESIHANEEPIRIEHSGRATWTLAPGSSAHLAARGRFLTVTLEKGSVLAEVVPGQVAESFAVEARQVRVAAHGTVFRVVLEDSQVDVEVTEGEIVVGPAEHRGNTQGLRLVAPGQGAFTLEGAPLERVAAETNEAEPPPLLPQPAVRPPRVPARPLPTPPSPQRVERHSAEAAADRVVAALRTCFVQHTDARGDVHVSATTRVTIGFGEDKVREIQLDPPLAPDVEACVRGEAQSVTVAASAERTVVQRHVWLSR